MKMEYPEAFYDAIMELTHYDINDYLPRLASVPCVMEYLETINKSMAKKIISVLKHPKKLVWRETGDHLTMDDTLFIPNWGEKSIRNILSYLRKSKIDWHYLTALYGRIIMIPEFKREDEE